MVDFITDGSDANSTVSRDDLTVVRAQRQGRYSSTVRAMGQLAMYEEMLPAGTYRTIRARYATTANDTNADLDGVQLSPQQSASFLREVQAAALTEMYAHPDRVVAYFDELNRLSMLPENFVVFPPGGVNRRKEAQSLIDNPTGSRERSLRRIRQVAEGGITSAEEQRILREHATWLVEAGTAHVNDIDAVPAHCDNVWMYNYPLTPNQEVRLLTNQTPSYHPLNRCTDGVCTLTVELEQAVAPVAPAQTISELQWVPEQGSRAQDQLSMDRAMLLHGHRPHRAPGRGAPVVGWRRDEAEGRLVRDRAVTEALSADQAIGADAAAVNSEERASRRGVNRNYNQRTGEAEYWPQAVIDPSNMSVVDERRNRFKMELGTRVERDPETGQLVASFQGGAVIAAYANRNPLARSVNLDARTGFTDFDVQRVLSTRGGLDQWSHYEGVVGTLYGVPANEEDGIPAFTGLFDRYQAASTAERPAIAERILQYYAQWAMNRDVYSLHQYYAGIDNDRIAQYVDETLLSDTGEFRDLTKEQRKALRDRYASSVVPYRDPYALSTFFDTGAGAQWDTTQHPLEELYQHRLTQIDDDRNHNWIRTNYTIHGEYGAVSMTPEVYARQAQEAMRASVFRRPDPYQAEVAAGLYHTNEDDAALQSVQGQQAQIMINLAANPDAMIAAMAADPALAGSIALGIYNTTRRSTDQRGELAFSSDREADRFARRFAESFGADENHLNYQGGGLIRGSLDGMVRMFTLGNRRLPDRNQLKALGEELSARAAAIQALTVGSQERDAATASMREFLERAARAEEGTVRQNVLSQLTDIELQQRYGETAIPQPITALRAQMVGQDVTDAAARDRILRRTGEIQLQQSLTAAHLEQGYERQIHRRQEGGETVVAQVAVSEAAARAAAQARAAAGVLTGQSTVQSNVPVGTVVLDTGLIRTATAVDIDRNPLLAMMTHNSTDRSTEYDHNVMLVRQLSQQQPAMSILLAAQLLASQEVEKSTRRQVFSALSLSGDASREFRGLLDQQVELLAAANHSLEAQTAALAAINAFLSEHGAAGLLAANRLGEQVISQRQLLAGFGASLAASSSDQNLVALRAIIGEESYTQLLAAATAGNREQMRAILAANSDAINASLNSVNARGGFSPYQATRLALTLATFGLSFAGGTVLIPGDGIPIIDPLKQIAIDSVGQIVPPILPPGATQGFTAGGYNFAFISGIGWAVVTLGEKVIGFVQGRNNNGDLIIGPNPPAIPPVVKLGADHAAEPAPPLSNNPRGPGDKVSGRSGPQ